MEIWNDRELLHDGCARQDLRCCDETEVAGSYTQQTPSWTAEETGWISYCLRPAVIQPIRFVLYTASWRFIICFSSTFGYLFGLVDVTLLPISVFTQSSSTIRTLSNFALLHMLFASPRLPGIFQLISDVNIGFYATIIALHESRV